MVDKGKTASPTSNRIAKLKEASAARGRACEDFMIEWNDRSSDKARLRLQHLANILKRMAVGLLAGWRGSTSAQPQEDAGASRTAGRRPKR